MLFAGNEAMTRKLNLLSLFAGIGGFELGLERSGAFKTIAQCEIDPFCQRVLAKHWPDVTRYDDVKKLTASRLAADGIAVDAICGGFPCQDISYAGKGAGIAIGTRSGLWYEYARLIGELGPRFVIVENVGALLSRGMDAVLGTLSDLGYDAEWEPIRASDVGAPHGRLRYWIVAYPHSERQLQSQRVFSHVRRWLGNARQDVPNADVFGLQRFGVSTERKRQVNAPAREKVAGSACSGNADRGWWDIEPCVGRVANGVPDRAHRLAALGNAVVPQIPELIGRAILNAMAEKIIA
jgi:DNA (cytosine-5)-methyltransferase 1